MTLTSRASLAAPGPEERGEQRHAGGLARRAEEQQLAAAEPVDGEHADGGGEAEDDAGDDLAINAVSAVTRTSHCKG